MCVNLSPNDANSWLFAFSNLYSMLDIFWIVWVFLIFEKISVFGNFYTFCRIPKLNKSINCYNRSFRVVNRLKTDYLIDYAIFIGDAWNSHWICHWKGHCTRICLCFPLLTIPNECMFTNTNHPLHLFECVWMHECYTVISVPFWLWHVCIWTWSETHAQIKFIWLTIDKWTRAHICASADSFQTHTCTKSLVHIWFLRNVYTLYQNSLTIVSV